MPRALLSRRMILSLWVLAPVLFLAQCNSVPRSPYGPLPKVTRQECMEIAEKYRTHRWAARPENAFHGNDPAGIRVDTPDVTFRPASGAPGWWRPGQVNEGIPYAWGGSDTPEMFDAALRQGKWAGDVYTSQKRAGLENSVSYFTTGVDCSGFISRCWKLEWHCSTRRIPEICTLLPDWNSLRPGDVLNTFNGHVVLFADYSKKDFSEILVYETGSPLGWKVMKHTIPVAFLKQQGYKPYRYQNMQD